MSFSATQKHRTAKAWSRTEGKDLRIKRNEDVPSDKRKKFKVKSLEPSKSTSGRPVPVAPPLPNAVPTRNASLASAAPSYIPERHYSRPIPGDVAYSPYPVSAVSNTQSNAIGSTDSTTPSHVSRIAHDTHSTYAASAVSDTKSHASTVSVTHHSAPGHYNPRPPQTISTPSKGTNKSHTSSDVKVTPSTALENPLLLPAPRERSRAPSVASVTPSAASGKYPALPASRDSSRASSVISAVHSHVLESHPPLPEQNIQNYRAPSVRSVASSAASVQHPPLPVSQVPSEVQNPQPSRSQSVVSAARSAVIEDHLLLPASGSRSPSVAPSNANLVEESSGYLQESDPHDISRASSSRALALRGPFSQPPAPRTASVTPSIQSEHAVSIPSAARRCVDEAYARSKVGNSLSVAESSARGRRPSVVYRVEDYADRVPKRAPSIAASTRSSIKSGRNERNVSTASKARSRIHEEDYEPSIQGKSTSKRASSIKPPRRSERGGSIAPKARSYIEADDHESSSERGPTSRRASSKASSSKSSRKASRDDRGRSTISRTESAYDGFSEVKVTHEEHEDDRTKSRPRSERSKSASTHRSSSVSSIETVRPGEDNALTVYHDNALHTAKASKDVSHRRSSRRKKSPAMSVVSVSTAAGLPVMRPDPSDSEAEQASGKKGQRSHHNRQQQQQHQPYRQPPYPQPYPPQCTPHYAQPYPQHQQYVQPQPQPQTTHGFYGYPNVYPQYTNQPYPNPQYTYPQPPARPYYPTGNPSQYVAPAHQYPTGYETLGEELEQGRKSGRLPKARDKRREKVERPRRRTHPEEEYQESPLVYERQKVYDKYPPNWFRDET